MTTRDEIREWIKEAQTSGATHIIVVCDTFDHEDYPVFVRPEESVHDVHKIYDNKNMQRVMEVYDLRLDIEKQLSEHRAFHF